MPWLMGGVCIIAILVIGVAIVLYLHRKELKNMNADGISIQSSMDFFSAAFWDAVFCKVVELCVSTKIHVLVMIMCMVSYVLYHSFYIYMDILELSKAVAGSGQSDVLIQMLKSVESIVDAAFALVGGAVVTILLSKVAFKRDKLIAAEKAVGERSAKQIRAEME